MKPTKKSSAPKLVLTPIKVKAITQAQKTGDIPVIQVEGDYPTRYNEAKAVYDEAEGFMKELKPLMLPDALTELFRHNSTRPWDPIKSVKLEDDNKNVTRITWVAKYKQVAATVVEALFGTLKTVHKTTPNVNDYFCKTMVGTFDSKCFLGPDGRFSQDNYDAVTEAMARVSRQLGIANPLTTEEAVVPLPDFDNRRWTDFDAATNAKIATMVPNQINFVPQPAPAPAQE